MDSDSDSFQAFFSLLWINPMVEIGLNLILLVILLVISAIISAAEMAYFSLQPADIFILQKSNKPQAALVLTFLERSKPLLSTLLVTNTFVNIAIVLVVGLLLNDCFTSEYISIIQFFIAWLLIVCVGEIAPKLYGSQKPIELAMGLSNFVRIIQFFSSPANFVLVNFTQLIEKRIKKRLNLTQHTEVSQQDIEQVIDIAMNKTQYAQREVNMIKSLVKFANKMVRSAMRTRGEIIAVAKTDSFEEIIATFRHSAYSRLPVYEEDLDTIVGILHFRDVIWYLSQSDKWKIDTVIREPYFVPENKKLDDLLADFQLEKQHLAVVIDEFGQTTGIITLEDVLENIVGEIDDEFDEPELELYQIIDDKNFIFQATVSLETMLEITQIDPERFVDLRQDSETLAGLLLILYQQMPQKGEIIQFEELEFTILEANERKIVRVRLTILSQNQTSNIPDDF
jgi:putative hemolysin